MKKLLMIVTLLIAANSALSAGQATTYSCSSEMVPAEMVFSVSNNVITFTKWPKSAFNEAVITNNAFLPLKKIARKDLTADFSPNAFGTDYLIEDTALASEYLFTLEFPLTNYKPGDALSLELNGKDANGNRIDNHLFICTVK